MVCRFMKERELQVNGVKVYLGKEHGLPLVIREVLGLQVNQVPREKRIFTVGCRAAEVHRLNVCNMCQASKNEFGEEEAAGGSQISKVRAT
jgi:hypothetical protein